MLFLLFFPFSSCLLFLQWYRKPCREPATPDSEIRGGVAWPPALAVRVGSRKESPPLVMSSLPAFTSGLCGVPHRCWADRRMKSLTQIIFAAPSFFFLFYDGWLCELSEMCWGVIANHVAYYSVNLRGADCSYWVVPLLSLRAAVQHFWITEDIRVWEGFNKTFSHHTHHTQWKKWRILLSSWSCLKVKCKGKTQDSFIVVFTSIK